MRRNRQAPVVSRRRTPGLGPVRKALLATLGPSSLNARVIRELEKAGVTTFRINMSHTALDELERAIDLIQGCSQVPICIDTSGGQIRTGRMRPGVELVEGAALMSRLEGVDACPEGGAAVAATRRLLERGALAAGDRVVVFNTGAGVLYGRTSG